MDTTTVRTLGFILACNARVESMKAENARDLQNGFNLTYGEQDFGEQAAQMERLASELRS